MKKYQQKSKLDSKNTSKTSKSEMSVTKLIMLCIVPDIKETYENVKFLFDLIKLNNI